MILRLKNCSLSVKTSFVLFKLFYKKRKFDEFGLRYSSNMLTQVKSGLYLYPLEWIADFVDGVTYGMVQTIIERPYSHEANVAKERIVTDISNCGTLHYNHINTTGIGNLAYIALYYPYEYVRKDALAALEKCFEDHVERVKLFTHGF